MNDKIHSRDPIGLWNLERENSLFISLKKHSRIVQLNTLRRVKYNSDRHKKLRHTGSTSERQLEIEGKTTSGGGIERDVSRE